MQHKSAKKFVICINRNISSHFEEFLISNGNWTQWSTIQGVIGRVMRRSIRKKTNTYLYILLCIRLLSLFLFIFRLLTDSVLYYIQGCTFECIYMLALLVVTNG